MAERVGFEPTTDFTRTRFPGERPRPLGDLSTTRIAILDFGFSVRFRGLIPNPTSKIRNRAGGEGGIRTHGELFKPSLVFETSSINRSDTSPGEKGPTFVGLTLSLHYVWVQLACLEGLEPPSFGSATQRSIH